MALKFTGKDRELPVNVIKSIAAVLIFPHATPAEKTQVQDYVQWLEARESVTIDAKIENVGGVIEIKLRIL